MQGLVSRKYLLPYLTNRSNWLWLGLYYILNFTDWMLTQTAIRSGDFVEKNPVWFGHETTVLTAILKLLVIPAVATLLIGSLNYRLSKWTTIVLVLANLTIVILNASTLWRVN